MATPTFSHGEIEQVRVPKLNKMEQRVAAAEGNLSFKVTRGTTPPSNPSVGDVWIDTN